MDTPLLQNVKCKKTRFQGICLEVYMFYVSTWHVGYMSTIVSMFLLFRRTANGTDVDLLIPDTNARDFDNFHQHIQYIYRLCSLVNTVVTF